MIQGFLLGTAREEPAPSSAQFAPRFRLSEPSLCVISMMAESEFWSHGAELPRRVPHPLLTAGLSGRLRLWVSFLDAALGQPPSEVGVRDSASYCGSISITSAPRVPFVTVVGSAPGHWHWALPCFYAYCLEA